MKKSVLRLLPIFAGMLMMACNTGDGEDGINEMGMPNAAYNSMDGDYPEPKTMGTGDKFEEFADNPFVNVSDEPTSTFSVDADGASYTIVRRYLSSEYAKWLSPQSIRIEEFLNYFTFDYPIPTDGHHVALNTEVSTCPWNTDHWLVRLGVKGKELAQSEVPQANFVFLIDVSGSMNGSDRLDLLKSGLIELLGQLNPDDRISIITYSGKVSKLLESTPVRETATIKAAISELYASGSTAGGEALKMAYEEALANFNPKANNRVIMGTDGDFNVGVTNTNELTEMVETYASQGIYMTCLGFGMGNLNDAMMEKLSNKGNGTYHYIDSEREMIKVFVHERNQFVSVANDAKCQITFDPELVSQYRLIGYENRVMNKEDFEDDTKDAGEIGAGQTITALYEVVPTPLFIENLKAGSPQSDKVFATFDFRYKKSLSYESLPLKAELQLNNVNRPVTANFNFAAGVAAYGMLLRKSPYKGEATYSMAAELVQQSLDFDPHGYRAELLELIKKSE